MLVMVDVVLMGDGDGPGSGVTLPSNFVPHNGEHE